MPVVVVALIGFWNWRTAILIAVSIPITLAITFGVIDTLGIDLQQVSVASLIIVLDPKSTTGANGEE